jgi:hypothetical protein
VVVAEAYRRPTVISSGATGVAVSRTVIVFDSPGARST